MSLAIKTGAGAFAGVVVCGLVYAFWPRSQPELVNLKAAVEKPVFVVATTPATTPAPATPVQLRPRRTRPVSPSSRRP